MRLFIAIELPQEICEYLQEMQEQLPEARLTLVKDFHLTLFFLGECGESRRARIEEACAQIRGEAFQAELGEMGVFGERAPRVVWIGVRAPAFLRMLVADIDARMKQCGFERDNRFVPHVTLARVRETREPAAFTKAVKRIAPQPLRFSVREWCLFESVLSMEKPRYAKLKAFPLG